MNPSSQNRQLHVYDPAEQHPYTLEVVAEITGVASQTILHYREQGLIHSIGETDAFDDEALHTLRRIEHLQQTCETNLSGLKLILNLMEQVDQLKAALRLRR